MIAANAEIYGTNLRPFSGGGVLVTLPPSSSLFPRAVPSGVAFEVLLVQAEIYLLRAHFRLDEPST